MRSSEPHQRNRRRAVYVAVVIGAAIGMAAVWAYLLLAWWPAQTS